MIAPEIATLLRDIRKEWVSLDNLTPETHEALLKRLEAAVTESNALPLVGWEKVYWDTYASKINGAQCLVRQRRDGTWCWDIMHSGEDYATEEEAKLDAVAAASWGRR